MNSARRGSRFFKKSKWALGFILVVAIQSIFSPSSAQAQNVFPQNGPVGIGTLSPTQKLSISGGNMTIDPSAGSAWIFFKNNTGTSDLPAIGVNNIDDILYMYSRGNGWSVRNASNTSNIFYIEDSGNAAIGGATASSLYSLNANGAINASAYYVNGSPVSGCRPIESFGGSGNGVTDNSPALNSAFQSSALGASGGCISFGPGKYRFNSAVNFNFPAAVAPYSITLTGVGQDVSILYFPASPGLVFNYSSPLNSIHLKGFSITTGTTNAGSAIALANQVAMGNFAQTDFEKITIRGDDGGQGTYYWGTGINITAVSNVNFDGLLLYGDQTGTKGRGIALAGFPPPGQGQSAGYGTVYNINKSGFYNLGVGLLYGSWIQGVTVASSNFVNGGTGIYCPAGTQGVLSQLAVMNTNFNTQYNQIATNTAVDSVQLMNNLFYVPAGAAGVYMPQNAGFTIVGNQFTYAGTPNTTQVGIIAGTTLNNLPSTITGNTFLGQATAISLQAGSSGINVQSNSYSSVGTQVTNSGSTTNKLGGGSL